MTLSERKEREAPASELEETKNADGETASSDDPKKFERRVKHLASKCAWPNWERSDTAWTVAGFAALSDQDRADAELYGEVYVRHLGKRSLALGNYFRGRKWLDLPAEVRDPPASAGHVTVSVMPVSRGVLGIRQPNGRNFAGRFSSVIYSPAAGASASRSTHRNSWLTMWDHTVVMSVCSGMSRTCNASARPATTATSSAKNVTACICVVFGIDR